MSLQKFQPVSQSSPIISIPVGARSYVCDTDFSLSSIAGHSMGRIFVAQSSSVNRSIVALRAMRPAFRAWTKGSRSDRLNAATSTFVLD